MSARLKAVLVSFVMFAVAGSEAVPKSSPTVLPQQQLSPSGANLAVSGTEGRSDGKSCGEAIQVELVDEDELAAIDEALRMAEARSHGNQSLPDIEDIGGGATYAEPKQQKTPSELHKSWGRKSIFVTDLVSQEWCEKQLDFNLRVNEGRQTETVSMSAGKERHTEVEMEVHSVIPVEVTSREDVLGLRLLNLRTSAQQIALEGIGREIPVFGFISGIFVTGVVDELFLGDDGKLELKELKTRSKPYLPSEAQMRGTRLQLCIYKRLWDNLVTKGISLQDLCKVYKVDAEATFTASFRKSLRDMGSQSTTLSELTKECRDALSYCTQVHSDFKVEYEYMHQGSRSHRETRDPQVLGEVTVAHDAQWLDAAIESKLPFWSGSEARPVSEDEAWKCRFCEFTSKCSTFLSRSKGAKGGPETGDVVDKAWGASAHLPSGRGKHAEMPGNRVAPENVTPQTRKQRESGAKRKDQTAVPSSSPKRSPVAGKGSPQRTKSKTEPTIANRTLLDLWGPQAHAAGTADTFKSNTDD